MRSRLRASQTVLGPSKPPLVPGWLDCSLTMNEKRPLRRGWGWGGASLAGGEACEEFLEHDGPQMLPQSRISPASSEAISTSLSRLLAQINRSSTEPEPLHQSPQLPNEPARLSHIQIWAGGGCSSFCAPAGNRSERDKPLVARPWLSAAPVAQPWKAVITGTSGSSFSWVHGSTALPFSASWQPRWDWSAPLT